MEFIRKQNQICQHVNSSTVNDVLGWKRSPVVFYHQLRLRNTTGLSFQPNNEPTSQRNEREVGTCSESLEVMLMDKAWPNPMAGELEVAAERLLSVLLRLG